VIPRLHLIATDEVLARPGFVERAERLLERGGTELALHLRARHCPVMATLVSARRLQQACDRWGGRLIVNDRVDVALAVGAAGVQLGARGLPVALVRERWPGLLIGASVHDVAAARAAVDGGADFLLAGTLWETASHPGRPGSGTAWLRRIPEPGRPVIGIGGVTAERAAELRAMAVHGAAVVRAIWEADSPEAALDEFLARLNGR
jgi:thiamine-phosphate diphosphorylase